MKKFILTMVIAMFAFVSTYAQQTTVEGSRLFDNTSVSVYGGGMSWINPSVSNSENFIKGVRPSFGIALDKWFTPIVGVEVFYDNSVNSFPFTTEQSRWTSIDFMNLGLNGEINLNNLFHKYKGEPDLFEVVPFVGMGWAHGYTNSPGSNLSTPEYSYGDHTANYMTANMGSEFNFNMGEKKAWQINIRPSIHYMIAGEGLNVRFNAQRAYVALQFGVTYKFGHKTSTGTKTHNFTKAYTCADYADLQGKYNALQKAYDEKPKEVEVERWIEKVVEKEVEVVKTEKTIPVPHFVKGYAIVDATTVGLLDDLADEMKSNDANYTLTGYASVEGDEKFNQELSLKRANAIKQCLVDRGVDADRLTAVGGGATSQFGDAYEPNRRVVVEKQ